MDLPQEAAALDFHSIDEYLVYPAPVLPQSSLHSTAPPIGLSCS